MNLKPSVFVLFLPLWLAGKLQTQEPGSGVIQSRIIKTDSEDLILVQEFVVEASVSDVWNAYVTEEGWTSWSAPVVEIDLRAGGTIKSHYDPEAKIGDPDTIVLHIVNYVPERVLTLRAELADHWPDVMKEDEENLMEVTIFQPLGPERTRVSSYGVGYRDSPAYEELIKFFIPANEGLYRKLKEYLEE